MKPLIRAVLRAPALWLSVRVLAFLLVGAAQGAVAQTLQDAFAAFERREFAQGLEILTSLANKGDAEAQVVLGNSYAAGGGGVLRDDAEAVRWYALAAAQGHMKGQLYLGQMYRDGRGVPKDEARALEWLRKAEAQGEAAARVERLVLESSMRRAAQQAAPAPPVPPAPEPASATSNSPQLPRPPSAPRAAAATSRPALADGKPTSCDTLAAHPGDPQKPSTIAGVADEAITAAAIEPCALAVQQNPQSARLKFQLGRALWAAGRDDDALEAFLQAEEADYAPAAFYLGLAHELGRIEGEAQDLAAAAELYLIAAADGFAPAVEAYQGIEWRVDVNFQSLAKPWYAQVFYEGRFDSLETLKPERDQLMFYIQGVHDFLERGPNAPGSSCAQLAQDDIADRVRLIIRLDVLKLGPADPKLSPDAQYFRDLSATQRQVGGLQGLGAYARRMTALDEARQAGTDDIYALAEDYGGCAGAAARQFYATIAQYVRSEPDPGSQGR